MRSRIFTRGCVRPSVRPSHASQKYNSRTEFELISMRNLKLYHLKDKPEAETVRQNASVVWTLSHLLRWYWKFYFFFSERISARVKEFPGRAKIRSQTQEEGTEFSLEHESLPRGLRMERSRTSILAKICPGRHLLTTWQHPHQIRLASLYNFCGFV